MKHGLIFLVFNCMFFISSAQTDQDITRSAQIKDQSSFNKLDSVYTAILKKYNSDATFITLFKKAQTAWKTFLDFEMAARFPEPSDGNYDKNQAMCFYLYRTELTNERINQLQKLLEKPTNDPCDGIKKNVH